MALASSLARSSFSPLSLRSSSLPPLPLPSPSPRLIPPPLPFTLSRPAIIPPSHVSIGSSAIAGALFAALASSDSAFASQQIMDLAANDNRGLALLIPLVPAVAWVLFNILKPALTQLDKMKGAKGVAVGLGLSGVASLLAVHHASAAQEIANLATDSDSRGLLLLGVLIPAVGWVLFNILQPALSQLDKMRALKVLVGATGLGAASMFLSPQADAAVQELASLADSDSRGLLVLIVLIPAVGWVLFNILQPALKQLSNMRSTKGVVGVIGLGAASAFLSPRADAAVQEVASIADSDFRGPLLLGILIPAVLWVLFNILQPGLSQLDKMKTGK